MPHYKTAIFYKISTFRHRMFSGTAETIPLRGGFSVDLTNIHSEERFFNSRKLYSTLLLSGGFYFPCRSITNAGTPLGL